MRQNCNKDFNEETVMNSCEPDTPPAKKEKMQYLLVGSDG